MISEWEEWETLGQTLRRALEAQFRRYEEHLHEELLGADTGEPIGIFNVKPVEQPWQLPADWHEHVGAAPAREHVYVAPLAGEVLERDEHGAWHTVRLDAIYVTDNRKVKFTAAEREATRLFKIPYAGS